MRSVADARPHAAVGGGTRPSPEVELLRDTHTVDRAAVLVFLLGIVVDRLTRTGRNSSVGHRGRWLHSKPKTPAEKHRVVGAGEVHPRGALSPRKMGVCWCVRRGDSTVFEAPHRTILFLALRDWIEPFLARPIHS
eukprot:ctg_94.g63